MTSYGVRWGTILGADPFNNDAVWFLLGAATVAVLIVIMGRRR